MLQHHEHTTAIGTVTGTVFTVAANIDSHDYMKTAILALIGATVSPGATAWSLKAMLSLSEFVFEMGLEQG